MIRLAGGDLSLTAKSRIFRSTNALVGRSFTKSSRWSEKAEDAAPVGIAYDKLTIGVPKETFALEKRVAASPESVARLVKPGFNVEIEKGAGEASYFNNQAYEEAGAKVVDDVWKSDIILKLRPPTIDEVKKLEDRTIVSFLWPQQNKELVEQLQEQKATAFAMDCIPRTLSRGQTYDALSSQANIAGYRAVLEASNEFGRFFAGQMTAGGTLPAAVICPAKKRPNSLEASNTARYPAMLACEERAS